MLRLLRTRLSVPAAVALTLALSVSSCERAGGSPDVIVYYFHNQIRCESCLTIERYAKQAVEDGFAERLRDGTLQWRVHDLDLEESRPFREQFQISTTALIVSAMEDGRPASWKNLDDVWIHVQDPEALSEYVRTEVAAFVRRPPTAEP